MQQTDDVRADRLVATLLLLQTRGRTTAAEVAAATEVSLATARRDLEALSAAGIPVYPQAGRGGGWQLVGGARTDLTGLTAPEARALFALLGPASSGRARPEARSALRKVLRALPQTFRAEAAAAADAVVVDPVGWGEQGRARPALADALEPAVVRRRQVRLRYAGRTREPSERLVDPWGLADKDGTWYLLAGTDAGPRTFRLDRVVHAEVTELPAARPDDLDVERMWERTVEEVERRRSTLRATVLIAPHLLPILQARMGRHCEPAGTHPDGRARAHVTAPRALDVARHLAGWGADVEVVEPASVRVELARIGAELVAANAG
ncbi:DeoR family transcriptional regulator [Cellulomonas fimi ATCC 484]|uniref:DeoR family transcriptional regulator n=1 Tax=Cellulomonas fimi (strain ATCC 484 / DSM 20113 / JCM 1341 / CCUG 24087 / LMG 16345 / NBRC 15513 / NCIMB 8980 / NCTC 7547 / NRS-133) TaxID=590998 RepID=F4H7I6_CELFA|nr:DeoR family transcriptional regulator [Cellulomonas fimi ATCC 484]VEH26576.1 HTH domain [Cellulomonas fimi]